MTKHEYDELQNNLSSLLEKKDVNGREIKRSQDYIDAVYASKSVLHSWFMYHNKENESEYRWDENKHKAYKEQIDQAKRMHWGIHCGSFGICHASGLCEVVCPGGGVGAREER